MDRVLSIDLSSNPTLIQLVESDQSSIRILEQEQVRVSRQPNPAQSLEPAANAEPSAAPPEEMEAQEFANVVSHFTGKYDQSVLVLSPKDNLSFRLSLPAKDPKNLLRLIESELQDSLPFEIRDYFLAYRVISTEEPTAKAQLTTIEASLVPRKTLSDAVAICKRAGLEPVVATLPSSGLAAIPVYHPAACGTDAILVSAQNGTVSLAVVHAGRIVAERSSTIRQPGDRPEVIAATADLSRTIVDFESHTPAPGRKLVALGNTLDYQSLSRMTGKTVEQTSLEELFGDSKIQLGSLASALVAHGNRGGTLGIVNFRTREFAYRGHLLQLLNFARSLLPYAAALLTVGAIVLLGLYLLRVSAIQTIESAIREEVIQALGRQVPEGDEMNQLQNEIETLQGQLNSLGTVNGSTPLDILALLSRELADKDLAFKRVSVKGKKIELKGTSSNPRPHKVVDEAEERLGKIDLGNKRLFCKVKGSVASASAGARGNSDISFEIELCD